MDNVVTFPVKEKPLNTPFASLVELLRAKEDA
jgi:hypothetical protein